MLCTHSMWHLLSHSCCPPGWYRQSTVPTHRKGNGVTALLQGLWLSAFQVVMIWGCHGLFWPRLFWPLEAKGKWILCFITYSWSVSEGLTEMVLSKGHPYHHFPLQNNRPPFKTTWSSPPLYLPMGIPAAFTSRQPFTLGSVSSIFQKSCLERAAWA